MFSASCVWLCSHVFCFNRATELASLERRIWSSRREDEHTLQSRTDQTDHAWLCEIQPKRDAIMLPDGVSMVTDGYIWECKVQRLSLKNTKTAMKEVFLYHLCCGEMCHRHRRKGSEQKTFLWDEETLTAFRNTDSVHRDDFDFWVHRCHLLSFFIHSSTNCVVELCIGNKRTEWEQGTMWKEEIERQCIYTSYM